MRLRGFGTVGVALVLSGLLVNGYLATVARYVSASDYAYFGAFWSLALLVGFGVYLPLEQVLARELPGAPDRATVLRATLRPAAVLLGVELLVAAAASPLLWAATGRNAVVLAAVAALCVVSAMQFLLRGWLIGSGAMGRYAVVLLVDTALRVGLAVVVGVAGGGSNGGFAWVLAAAIAVAHVPLLAVALRPAPEPVPSRACAPRADGPADPRAVTSSALFTLVAGSLAGQLVLSGIPVAIAGLADVAQEAAVGRFQAAFQLVRIPLFLATPLQATLVPAFAAAVAAGGHPAARRLVLRFGLVLLALAAVGAALGLLAGPVLVQVIFGSRYTVDRVDVALLATGSACYLVGLVVTQLLVVQHRVRGVAAAWASGVVAAAVVLAAVDDLLTAAVWSFVAGSAVAATVGLVGAAVRGRAPDPATG